jgi:hypothetical protein
MFQVRESNMTYVEPSSQHPSAVLVDLQHLDVVNCESEAHRRQDERCSNPGLSRQGATEGLTRDHDRSDVGDVSVDTVKYSDLLSDYRSEL